MGAFNQIQCFFMDKEKIDDWINQAEKIIEVKEQIKSDEKYVHHPFNSIASDEIKGILNILVEIKAMTLSLISFEGEFKEHLSMLKDIVLNSNDDSELKATDSTDFQKIIKKFSILLDNLTSDSTIKNIDSAFFAKHLKNIVSSIESSEVLNRNNFNLPILNILNLKHYKYVFFMGLENDKYPRKHEQNFPFTPEIIDVIHTLGINSYNTDIYRHNLLMEKYFFRNVFEFTNKELWLTCTQRGQKQKNNFSTYVKDIMTFLDGSCLKEVNNEILSAVTNKTKKETLYTTPKKEYSVKELVTFSLCPKLYYHLHLKSETNAFKSRNLLKLYAENVFFIDLFDRFMNYNFENKKWYSSHENEWQNTLNSIAKEVLAKNRDYFDCFKPSDLETIKDKTLKRAINHITSYIIEKLKYDTYTIAKPKEKIYRCKNFDLKLEYDTAIFSPQHKRLISQNNVFLDFLTLKCTNRDIKENHYKGMLKDLNGRNKFTDRIFFANRMISKINVQFDSKVERFISGYDGGLERVKNIVDDILSTDFLSIYNGSSNFCNYCIMSDVCMGGKESQKVLEVKE